MARTGSAAAAALIVALVPAAALAEVEFHMSADRAKIGTEDTLRVQIVVGNAPNDALVQFPKTEDFEVLGRSESTEMGFSVGPGGAGVIKQVKKYTLTVRANRTGKLTIPPAVLKSPTGSVSTESLHVEVVTGRLAPDRPPQPNNPFAPFGLPGFPGLDDEDPSALDPFGQQDIPPNESDLFLRASVDKTEPTVGEQVTYTLYIYSRVDVSSVNSPVMPKFDGFWSQDLKTSTTLSAEQRLVGGVPYRAFLLRQKALFPMKAGEYTLSAPEAEIVTGFLLGGRAVKKKGNELTLKVKPLPAGLKTSNVGQWRLSTDVTQTEVNLGEPVQLHVVVEGRGNLQALEVPKPEIPAGLRAFDPQVTEKASPAQGRLGGSRIVEYVLVPQQTGTFVIPGLTLPFYDPDAKRADESRTDAITLTVKGATGATPVQPPSSPLAADGPKNELAAGGLKPLRHTARFTSGGTVLWQRAFFAPLALAPLGLALAIALASALRRRLSQEDDATRLKRQAKAARKRLTQAHKQLAQGSTEAFYGEVDHALRGFLEAKLGQPVAGLTRPQLDELMKGKKVKEAVRSRVSAVFETCDMGRFAPGMGDAAARQRALDDAAKAMEGWS